MIRVDKTAAVAAFLAGAAPALLAQAPARRSRTVTDIVTGTERTFESSGGYCGSVVKRNAPFGLLKRRM